MAKINFPSFFCVKLLLRVEAVMMVFFSFLVINQTWYQGGGGVHAQKCIFLDVLIPEMDFLLANFIKAQETG